MPSKKLSIRTRLTIVMTLLLAIMSVGIYLYFPARFKAQAVNTAIRNAAVLTEMTSSSIAEGISSRNPTAIAKVLASLRRNPQVVYLMVLDQNNEVAASFNPMMASQVGYTKIARAPIRVAFSMPHERAPASRAPAGDFPGDEIDGGLSADGTIYQTVTAVRDRGRRVGTMYLGVDLESINASLGRSRATVALVTAIAFMVGVVGIFFLSTLITGPLKRISETAEQIAEGDLTRRAEVGGGDEVGQLAVAFNLMIDRLNGAREQLEQWGRTLEQRVDERTRELKEEVDERRRAEDALRESEERYRLLFERNLAGVYIASPEGLISSCNETCASIFGFSSPESLVAASASVPYRFESDRAAIDRRLRKDGLVLNEEVELDVPGNEPRWILENVRLVEGRNDEPPRLEGIVLDITDHKRAEQEMVFRAYHDALTGLPNRGLFLDRLNVQLANAERSKTELAVLFLDLDDMKTVNDTLGHATGDELLKGLGERLASNLRKGDTVARVGGDEFLILLSNIRGELDAERVAKKVHARVSDPFLVSDDEVHVTTSMGCALYPLDGDDAEALIRNADGAMYRVKERGGNGIELCSRTGRRGLGRLSLEQQIRDALDRDEFVAYFQPQVNIRTGALSGTEALVRWNHTDGTVIEPSGFVAVAEQTGLISAIGESVLRKSCVQMERWREAGHAPPRLSVNVSARQLYQRDFLGTVERVLDETGYDPSSLELEITESSALQRTDRNLRMLQRLRGMGIGIAIDDFGTGQSSLTYLNRFEIDAVKIDKSFICDIGRHKRVEWIVTAVLLLSAQLSLRTVAEGVETEEQMRFLSEHGCDHAQGYLISRPLAPAAFEQVFLKANWEWHRKQSGAGNA